MSMFRCPSTPTGIFLAICALTAALALPVSAQTASMRPLKVDIRPVTKFANTRPNFIPNLAAIRHRGICANQAAMLKNAGMKQFIAGLAAPPGSMVAGTSKPNLRACADGEQDWVPIQLSAGDALSADDLEPVSFLAPNAQPAGLTMRKVAHDAGAFWHHADTAIEWADGANGTLCEGVAVVAPSRPVDFTVGQVQVSLRPGAAVLLKAGPEATRIVNLMDRHRNDVVVRFCERQKLALRPGYECLVGTSEQAVKGCQRWEKCGRRFHRIACHKKKGLVIAVSEVSIPSLLKNHSLVRQIYTSADDCDRKLAGRLLKMSACLAVTTKSRSAYNFSE